ncbi:MAG: hypothetical protein GTN49_09945 [candidate division Zixibacteria bacterium]|nr:hypothetical protein [candidate division Zixibacteria bacterium]
MKKLFTGTAAALGALAAVSAFGGWVYEGQWGSEGSGDGQFNQPEGLGVAPNRDVYIADSNNHRVQYFSASGSFRGKWGTYGTRNGQFNEPSGVGVADNGTVYVTDMNNDRVQYFRWSDPRVAPTSLGRVKALFR